MNNNLIFIQIAAYRDGELLPTLRDCVDRASNPSRLRFGICWQRTVDETLAEFAEDARVKIFRVSAERSRGACWARRKVQELYEQEAYTLQLDSHHRFVDGWDEILVEMLEELRSRGHEKPLITAYVPYYDPQNDPQERHNEPLRMRFDGFSEDGPFRVMPEFLSNFAELNGPEPARFFSGHFAFTVGRFCNEVPYDPQFYFFGEEPSMAMRAYSQGYDLFHPHKVIAWHFYGRDSSPRHWADHQRWWFRNELSMRRFRVLVDEGLRGVVGADSSLAPYGMGTVRSLQDYERYAGISFEFKGATAHAMKPLPPPEPVPPQTAEEWLCMLSRSYELRVTISKDELPSAPEDYDFVFVGAHSANGDELYRYDLLGDELLQSLQEGFYQLSFMSNVSPVSWTVWPYLRERGWGTKCTRQVNN
jgi:hypothetical protein